MISFEGITVIITEEGKRAIDGVEATMNPDAAALIEANPKRFKYDINSDLFIIQDENE